VSAVCCRYKNDLWWTERIKRDETDDDWFTDRGYQLSQKIGIKIGPDYIDKTVAAIDSFPYDFTSSLTRDVWDGRPSEIEYQNELLSDLEENMESPRR